MNLHEFVCFHCPVIVALLFCNLVVMMTLYVDLFEFEILSKLVNQEGKGFFHIYFSSTKLKGLFIIFSILNLLIQCQKSFDANINKCKYCKTFVILNLSQSFQPLMLIPKLIHHYLKTMMYVTFFNIILVVITCHLLHGNKCGSNHLCCLMVHEKLVPHQCETNHKQL